MNLERLWAPWRLQYIVGDQSQDTPPKPIAWLSGADHSCFLCRAAARFDRNVDADRRLLVVTRHTSMMAVLNRFPYNNGHLLIAPLRHTGDLTDLSREEHAECMELLTRFTVIYRERLGAEGFNIGLNLGHVAGAGVPGHLHWHLVPRWPGDYNFMPVLAGVRVIPQSLDELWVFLQSVLD